ncbi:hypothetical protein MASR1M36_08100 [Candidatus Cloacimonadaceae bacterium]
MRKTLLILVIALLSMGAMFGQYIVNFEGATETKTSYASGTVNLSGMDWNMTEALIGNATADWKNGTKSARMRGYGTSSMSMLADKASGLGTLSFQYRRYGTDTQVDWKAEYSTDGGTNWTQIGTAFTAPASDEVQTFSSAVNVSGNVRVRIKRATESGTSNNRLNIDDITLTDYAGSIPTINVSGTLNPFSTYTGTPSTSQSYSLSGSNLTANIAIAALTGFQYSTDNSSWQNSLSLASSYNGPVYVRLSGAAAGSFSGDIAHSSAGASSVNLAVSGSVNDPVPAINVGGALNAFGTTTGTPSAAQTYNLSGSFLTANIVVTPPAGYEVSSDGSSYLGSLSLPSSYSGVVYVRLTGSAAGTFNGNITHTSTGATQVDLAVSGTVTDPASATTYLEENFNYVVGTTASSNGWSAHSSPGTASPLIDATNLSYTNYPASYGGSVRTTGVTGEDISRGFTPQTSGEIYCAWLMNITSMPNTTQDYFFHLGDSNIPLGTSTIFRGRLIAQRDASNNIRFALSKGTTNTSMAVWTGGTYASGTYDYAMNTTYMFVMKYKVIPGSANDEVYLWINPTDTENEPAYTLFVGPTDTTSDPSDIGSVAIRQSANTPAAYYDGIRITNDWAQLWSGEAPPTPVISVSTPELDPLVAIVNTPSDEIRSYTLSGENISGGITITPSNGFQVSTSEGGPWLESLVTPADFNNLIYVRFYPAELGDYTGNIEHTSPGATTVNVAINGESVPPAVTWNIPASLPAFSGEALTPTAAQSYSLSATNATENLLVSTVAPFELSTTGTGGWTNSLSLAPTFNASVYVRMNASSAGTFNVNISHTTANASEGLVALSGTATPAPGMAVDLFFSEYIEGSSNNKVLEIFNGTGGAVDLSDYKVELYANGSTTPGNTLTMSGTLAHGDVYVIANSSANATILGLADITSTITYFNGDDAVAIKKISTDSYVDIFGVIGQDPDLAATPSLGWIADGGYSTVNKTLVRKPSVSQGISVNPTMTGPNVNTDFVTLSTEWDVYPTDTLDYLGTHTFNPGGNPMAATPSFDPAEGTYMAPINVSISCSTPGATIRYTINGDVPNASSTLYSTPINISATTTLKAVAFATGFEPSAVGVAVYTFPVDVANIAALRAMPTGGTVYRLTGEAVLTFQQSTRNQKYVQDATAAIVIDDPAGVITTTYSLYDGITGLVGTLGAYSNLLQFTPVANPSAATSTGNVVVPAVRTSATVSTDDQAKLLKLMNVTIDATNVNFGTAAENINVTDAAGTIVMRTFPATDYSGTAIPTAAVDIVCLGGQFGTTMQISPRFLADITPAAGTLEAPIINISQVGGTVSLSWAAVAGATSYRVEAADDPYGAFTELSTTTNLFYSGAATAKKFYRVIAIN